MKAEDLQYSISDLSRALLREFLSQKGLKKTLEAFEKQDLRNKKKINKNLLIEMLSLKNLFLLNKQSRDSKTSLLEILVAYLNKKYQVKKNTFATTQPQASFPKLLDTQQPQKIEVPYKQKERPGSSKPFKSYEIESAKQNVAPLRQKDELKVIYQKISKKEEGKDFRIVQSNALKKGQPSKIQEKPAHLEQQLSKEPIKHKALQIEDEYKQEFQDVQNKQDATEQKVQVKLAENTIIQKPKNIESRKPSEPSFEKQPQQPAKTQKDDNSNRQKPDDFKAAQPISRKQQVIRESKLNEMAKKDTIKESKDGNKLFPNSNSQQNLNPTPILHISSQKLQSQSKQITKIMGSSANIAKKQQEKVEEVKQEPQQRNRTEMRQIGRKKEDPATDLLISEPNNQPLKQQPNKKVETTSAQTTNTSKKAEPIKKQAEAIKVQAVPSVAAPVMVTLGKKRKAKQQVNQEAYPTKFKFDENFTHEIQKQAVYQYKEYRFEPITIAQNASELYPDIIVNPAINYKQKGGGVPPIKRKLEKIIASKDAQRLKKVVFQSSPAVLPKSWVQGFILSPHEQTPYGLKQIEGGPCGIIAALQCYFLKHLMLCSGQKQYNDETLREVCLVAAMTNMLWKVKSTDKFLLAFPPKGATKVEISNLRTVTVEANDFATAFAGVWSVRDEYIGNSNHGVASMLYSIVLTKGIDLIEGQMDIKQNPLIGNHGHCTQQFVNLLLTGKATSNIFDGDKVVDDYKLKGIINKSQFGFLTIFEALKYLQVGKNLKNPIFPAWVICKEFHYHVIFASHYLISESNKSTKFDIVYFDGLYNCGDRIRLTLESLKPDEEDTVKVKDLPLIEQVMMTKWGRRVANWNGSTKIL